MTTERWALVPVEATPDSSKVLTGPDKYWKQACAEIYQKPIKDIDGSLIQTVRDRAEQLRAADAEGAALLAEVLAALNDARDLTAAALSEERAKFKGYEHCSDIPSIEADLARLDSILDKLGPAAEGAT